MRKKRTGSTVKRIPNFSFGFVMSEKWRCRTEPGPTAIF